MLILLFFFAAAIFLEAQTPTPPNPTIPPHCLIPCRVYYDFFVKDIFDNPVAGASVSGMPGISMLTDNNGYCQIINDNGTPGFGDCIHGTTLWYVSAPGYVSASGMSGISCPGYTIHFNLKPQGGSTPTPKPTVPVAKFLLSTAAYSIQEQDTFLSLYLEAESNTVVSAYNLSLAYDPALLKPDPAIGINGVEAGTQGFFTTAVAEPGIIRVTGRSETGIGPVFSGDPIQELLKWHFKTLKGGSTELQLSFQSLLSADNTALDYIIRSQTPLKILGIGDVNFDLKINIIDALMTAQYSVGSWDDAVYYQEAADVNRDEKINIIDALIMAQYYVGLISRLPL